MRLLAYLHILKTIWFRFPRTLLLVPLDLAGEIADPGVKTPDLLSREIKVLFHAEDFAARHRGPRRQIGDPAFPAVELADRAAHGLAVAFHALDLEAYSIRKMKTRTDGLACLPCIDHRPGLSASRS